MQEVNFEPVVVEKPARSFDAIIYTVLCAAAGALLFVDGFFIYHYYFIMLLETESDRPGSFMYLISDTELVGIILITVIIACLAAVLVCAWIGFFTRKYIKIAGIVCSGTALIGVVIGVLYGMGTFHEYDYDHGELFGVSVPIESISTFNSMGILFYIELAVLAAIIALSILNTIGIDLLKKKVKKKIDIVPDQQTENQQEC